MLIRVTVENYKSFDEREEFNMIASKNIKNPEKYMNHCVYLGEVGLLKIASLYGANASGKSNFISVLSFLKNVIGRSDDKQIDEKEDYCRNRPENRERESLFDIQFSIGDKMYSYGFSVVLSRWKITREWLYEITSDDNGARPLFERIGGKAPIIGDAVMPSDGSADKSMLSTFTQEYVDDFSHFFLTYMSKKKFSHESKLSFFKRVFDWIDKDIFVITPSVGIASYDIFYKEEYIEKISEMIKHFDTGITYVGKEIVSEDEWGKAISRVHVNDAFKQLDDAPGRQILIGGNKMFILSYDRNRERVVEKLVFNHKKTDAVFDFSDESDGTRRLIELLDILITDRSDVVYVVDELERSFHPKLTEYFLKMFIETHKNANTQLIIATHENTIMSTELFRRDEIWFVEKNMNNVSKIYPLDLYTDMYDNEVGRLYLDGRYGAVPMFK